MLAILDIGARVVSWIAGHWKGAILLALVLAVWGYGRWQYSAGVAATEAVWEARAKDQADAARSTESRWKGAAEAADRGLQDAQTAIAARDDAIGRLADELRKRAARPVNVSRPANPAQCTAELAAERDRADALGVLLVRGSDLARTLAAERDDAVARLWAAADAWPR